MVCGRLAKRILELETSRWLQKKPMSNNSFVLKDRNEARPGGVMVGKAMNVDWEEVPVSGGNWNLFPERF